MISAPFHTHTEGDLEDGEDNLRMQLHSQIVISIGRNQVFDGFKHSFLVCASIFLPQIQKENDSTKDPKPGHVKFQ